MPASGSGTSRKAATSGLPDSSAATEASCDGQPVDVVLAGHDVGGAPGLLRLRAGPERDVLLLGQQDDPRQVEPGDDVGRGAHRPAHQKVSATASNSTVSAGASSGTPVEKVRASSPGRPGTRSQ